MTRKQWPFLKSYDSNHLRKIALPLGGIGTGTVSLGGRGNLRDWEIMNRPAKGFTPNNRGLAPLVGIRDMTDRLHVSEATLARAVHKRYRMSPLQLLIQVRISAASRLLMTSSLSVAAVGERVGYQSPSSFTRLFIKHMSVSPGRFRRKSQEHGLED